MAPYQFAEKWNLDSPQISDEADNDTTGYGTCINMEYFCNVGSILQEMRGSISNIYAIVPTSVKVPLTNTLQSILLQCTANPCTAI